MRFYATDLPGVVIVEIQPVQDERGFLMETFHAARFREAGLPTAFTQDLITHSKRGTLRGLHFQEPRPQGKLIQVLTGTIFDVAVDIRRGSPTFRRWISVELSRENRRQLWISPGFAHGFCVLSETADVSYKLTDLYDAQGAQTIVWSDPDLAIPWPVTQPLLSPKDAAAPCLSEALILPSI